MGRPHLQIVGKKFGKLLVLDNIGTPRGAAGKCVLLVTCKCDCGNIVVKTASHLVRGAVKSCGCALLGPDHVGKKYGRWSVLTDLGSRMVGKSKKRFVLCKCECGTEKELSLSNLKTGISRSCGCLKREITIRVSRKPKGAAASRSLYSNYACHARKRNLRFELTIDQFKEITKRNCWYCGAAPGSTHRLLHSSGSQKGLPRVNGSYKYNGIDRVDSKKGYSMQNCVASCGTCNKAKSNMSKTKFINWVKRISAHQKTGENENASN